MNPVQVLYHGTSYKYANQIKAEGLKAINYDKVYLTADVEVAYEYARRSSVNNSSEAVICVINAPLMVKDGFRFDHEHTYAEWTTDNVPSKYLTLVLVNNDGELEELVHYAQEQVNNQLSI